MKTATSESSKFVNYILVALVACFSGFYFSTSAPSKAEKAVTLLPAAPKLSGKALDLSQAIMSDNPSAASAILKSAKNAVEVHELARQVAWPASRNIIHSVIVDGKKETVMFYHCNGASLVEPVAGIVEDSL